MGQQIIRQPDGLFSIFSSVVDSFILIDASADDVVQHFEHQAATSAAASARRQLEKVLANDGSAYFQFTKTWMEALAMHRRHGDKDEPEIELRLKELELMEATR